MYISANGIETIINPPVRAQVEFCKEILLLLNNKTSAKPESSYLYKHIVEAYGKAYFSNGAFSYISNGAFILAAKEQNIQFTRKNQGLNADFTFSFDSFNLAIIAHRFKHENPTGKYPLPLNLTKTKNNGTLITNLQNDLQTKKGIKISLESLYCTLVNDGYTFSLDRKLSQNIKSDYTWLDYIKTRKTNAII